MNKTFNIFSFGCRVNEAEKQILEKAMFEAGFSINLSEPTFCIVNTCAVTIKAEREARQLVYRLRRDYPQAKIVITGCAATYWKNNQLNLKLPIDLLVGNSNKKDLVRFLILAYPSIFLSNNQDHPTGRLGWNKPNDKFIKSGRIPIKIQDGCQRFCSYCIVPFLRGQPQSERISGLESRVKNLPDNTMEVILTAINTEAFGLDTKEKFIDLIKTIVDKTNIARISFGSINPWSITNEFLQFYQRYLPEKRLVNFFHIPLQSGSNKILTLMKRGYTRKDYAEKLNVLYRINPFTLITTDIIVGFLDETDKDFQETYDFLKNSPISRFHVFRFSIRKNTAAYFMAKKLKEPSVSNQKKRAKLLRNLSEKKFDRFLSGLANYSSTALFINKSKGDFQQALLDNQVVAWIKTSKNLNGEIKNVKILEYKTGELFGKTV